MAQPQNKTFATDPALWIFTSLTAGSSHIVTATSRLETILRANRIPFKAVDIATHEKARMLWGRRAGKDANGRPRKLPGLVQTGVVLGDLVEVEEWNEYGELKENVKIYFDDFTIPTAAEAASLPSMKSMSRPVPTKTPAAIATATAVSAPERQVASAIQAAASIAAKHAAMKEKEAKKKKTEEEEKNKKEEAKPGRSLADEAAERAKAIRLKGLREKVEADKKRQEEKEKAEKEDLASKPDDKPEVDKAEEKFEEKKQESPTSSKEETASPDKKDQDQQPPKPSPTSTIAKNPSKPATLDTKSTTSPALRSPVVVIPPPTLHNHGKATSPSTDYTTEQPVPLMDPAAYDRLRAALQEPSSFTPLDHDTRSIAETMDLSSGDDEAPRSISEGLARLSRSGSAMSLRESVNREREREREREWAKLAGKVKELGGVAAVKVSKMEVPEKEKAAEV